MKNFTALLRDPSTSPAPAGSAQDDSISIGHSSFVIHSSFIIHHSLFC